MSGRKVNLGRIVLEGFGRYHGRVEVRLAPGLNTLVARNEQGKSTLIAGVVAVLFGLGAREGPFSLSRYRNWEGPLRCRGEVELEAGGTGYRIERDFDTHQVALWGADGGGQWVQVLRGTHNPAARSRNEHYESWLEKLLGVTSRELFLATYCVTQPLPTAERLDASVQELVSGGGAQFAQAQKTLVAELRELTRFTAERGVTARNAQNDRELEQLEAAITVLERRIVEGSEVVDRLEHIQRELEAATAQLRELEQRRRTKQRALEAWSEWQRRREKYDAAVVWQERLQAAVEEAQRLEQTLAKANAERELEFPELVGALDQIEAGLTRLAAERGRRDENRARLQAAGAELEGAEKAAEKLRAELAAEGALEALGPDPVVAVRALRRISAGLVPRWEQYEADCRCLAEVKAEIDRKYSALASAPDEELEALADYAVRRARLEAAQTRARSGLDAAGARRDAYTRACQQLAVDYGDLADLGPAAEVAATSLLGLRARAQELHAGLAAGRRRLLPPPAVRLLAAAGLGLLVLAVYDHPLAPVLAAAGAALGFAGAGLVFCRLRAGVAREVQALAGELHRVEAAMAEHAAALGNRARGNDGELGVLAERLRRRRADQAAVEELARAQPAAGELAALQAALEEAEAGLASLDALAAKFAAGETGLADTYAQWEALTARARQLAERVETFCRRECGTPPGQAGGAVPASAGVREEWRELAHGLSVLGKPTPGRLDELVELVRDLEPGWWERQEKRAHQWVRLREELRDVAAQVGTWQAQVRELAASDERLDVAVAGLEAPLGTVLTAAAGDLEVARERCRLCRALEQEAESAATALRAIYGQHGVDSLAALRVKLTSAGNEAVALWQRLEEHVRAYPGLPAAGTSPDPGALAGRIEALQAEAQTMEEEAQKLGEQLRSLEREQSRLQGHEPVNIAACELELCELRFRRDRLLTLTDALTEAYRELGQAVVAYQRSYRQHLEDVATGYLRSFTGLGGRRVCIDEEFAIGVEEEGRPCAPGQLSKGAQDQLYIALRLAIGDLMAGSVTLPFIFDDAFVSSDAERLVKIRAVLERAAGERQLILAAHAATFAEWGTPVSVELV